MSTLNLYGNHRGGTSIVTTLPAEVAQRYEADWLLADPKEDRAEQLARVVQQRFPWVHPRPQRMTAQHALTHSRDDDTQVLALDTVADTMDTLAARRPTQRATFQLVGRGPGGYAGARTALQGTLAPGDHDTAHRTLLLDTLEGLTQAASSRVLTEDALTAAVLQPMRDLATRQTIRHLAEPDRDPWDLSGGPLSMVVGATVYPLVPVQGQPQDRYAHRKALALDVAGTLPAGRFVERGALGRFVIVAVVVPEDRTIHFLTVAQSRAGRSRVDGVTIFAPPPPAAEPWQTPIAVPAFSPEPAVFTD